MKKTGWLLLILPILLVVLPLGRLSETPDEPLAEAVAESPETAADSGDSFRVRRSQSETVEVLSVREYLCGVVAAEMPASYEVEALKAQAVAAFTFALRRQAEADGDYDLTDDYTVDQAYIDEAQQQEKWGDRTAEYRQKIAAAVDAVAGQTVQYEGALALTVYCGMSAGVTESAADVWGSEIPYLIEVDSAADRTAENYKTVTEMPAAQLQQALADTVTLSDNPTEWFGNFTRSAAGGVQSAELCGTAVSGQTLRKALGLCSAAFDVCIDDEIFTFTCYGHGHGVGMSQYGANRMAQDGADYQTILLHYYPGCTVV